MEGTLFEHQENKFADYYLAKKCIAWGLRMTNSETIAKITRIVEEP